MRDGIWHSRCGKIGNPEGFEILKIVIDRIHQIENNPILKFKTVKLGFGKTRESGKMVSAEMVLAQLNVALQPH